MSTRIRMDDATSAHLRSDSLVGSYFLIEDQQGVVVAEPSPGFFLVELADWIAGASTAQQLVGIAEQRLVNIEAMAEWRFFDTPEGMRNVWDSDAARSGKENEARSGFWRGRRSTADDSRT